MKKYFEIAGRVLIIGVFGFVFIGGVIWEAHLKLPWWQIIVSAVVLLILFKLRLAIELLNELATDLPARIQNPLKIAVILLFLAGGAITLFSVISVVEFCDPLTHGC